MGHTHLYPMSTKAGHPSASVEGGGYIRVSLSMHIESMLHKCSSVTPQHGQINPLHTNNVL